MVSVHIDPQEQTCSSRFAAVGLTGRRYRLIAAAAAYGRQMQAVPHY